MRIREKIGVHMYASRSLSTIESLRTVLHEVERCDEWIQTKEDLFWFVMYCRVLLILKRFFAHILSLPNHFYGATLSISQDTSTLTSL